MKIALIGYGKMGKMIHQLAEKKGHSIVATLDSKVPLNTISMLHPIKDADVCIDFSVPDTVLENIKILSSLKKNIVLGTTGWTDHLKTIQDIVHTSNIGLIHSSNFSLGIALFLKIIDQAGKFIFPFPEYEAAGIEMHHSQKIDIPSGTAKAIENKLNQHSPHPINFSSLRLGNIPGIHTVIFDSPVDTITLTHNARNREGFAKGAITAAEWLQGKKGVFTLEDLLSENKT